MLSNVFQESALMNVIRHAIQCKILVAAAQVGPFASLGGIERLGRGALVLVMHDIARDQFAYFVAPLPADASRFQHA